MSLTGAQQRELDGLRRRAYGRGSDSAMDADAWSRLAELEQAVAVRPEPVGPAPVVESPPLRERRPPAAEAAAEEPVSVASGSTSSAAVVELGREPASGAPRSRRRLRRSLPWLVAAVASVVAVAAIIVAAVVALSGPRPAMRLAAGDTPDAVQAPAAQSVLEFWGIGNQPFDYRGTMGEVDLWTVSDGFSMRCVLFSVDGEFVAQNCAPLPLAAIFETLSQPDVSPWDSLGDEVPEGSYVRFLWEGDTLDVYIVPPSEREST